MRSARSGGRSTFEHETARDQLPGHSVNRWPQKGFNSPGGNKRGTSFKGNRARETWGFEGEFLCAAISENLERGKRVAGTGGELDVTGVPRRIG